MLGNIPSWGVAVWGSHKQIAQRVMQATTDKSYGAPDSWAWRIDCLHAIAATARDQFGCCYWHTDGGDNASEVEVRFTAETPERTRLDLEHRHIDRHGPGWEAVRDGVGHDQGWPLYLARYAEALADIA